MNLFAENGIHMFLWIGLGASPDFIQKVFGVPSAIQVDIEKVALPELDTPLSVAVRTIIDDIRTQRHKCMRVSQNGFFSTENSCTKLNFIESFLVIIEYGIGIVVNVSVKCDVI
jgi:hypothetical protein